MAKLNPEIAGDTLINPFIHFDKAYNPFEHYTPLSNECKERVNNAINS